ncbi:hypothetical protein [Bacillus sp. V5-8f]|uniref:hypothetical protein n=1 Tax=Bacillus sp. V5-8f TaxID=2053044 RepID=UPI002155F1D8|nr:hypothetical protein [Bacillus sp. V5-8f]
MIKNFLVKEGVPLPQISSQKAVFVPAGVPEGVKLTEDEKANLISVKVATTITLYKQ